MGVRIPPLYGLKLTWHGKDEHMISRENPFPRNCCMPSYTTCVSPFSVCNGKHHTCALWWNHNTHADIFYQVPVSELIPSCEFHIWTKRCVPGYREAITLKVKKLALLLCWSKGLPQFPSGLQLSFPLWVCVWSRSFFGHLRYMRSRQRGFHGLRVGDFLQRNLVLN